MKKNKKLEITYGDVWRFSMDYWGRYPVLMIAAVVFMMTSVVADVIVPVYTGQIMDHLTQGDAAATTKSFVVFMALSLVHTVFWSLAFYTWNVAALRNLKHILEELSHKVIRFSTDWHANAFAGGTVRKITRAMWAFDRFEDTLFMGLLPAAIIMLGMSVMLLIKVPLVGLYATVTMLIYVGMSIYMSVAILAPKFTRSAAKDTAIGAMLADVMTGVPTVKAFGAEGREDERFQALTGRWYQIFLNACQTGQTTDLLRSIVRNFMVAGMVGMSIWMWREGTATPGDIVLALTSGMFMGGYLREVGRHIAELQKAISEMEDGITFWLRKDDIVDKPEARLFVRGKGRITFDNVRFTYDGQNDPLYDGFSLAIAEGEHVALVGHSGSGKSTFIKLVQRLYDVQGGEIRIDGQDIADVTQDSLRRAIALVPQEPILFHRSLAENIAYGKPGASMGEIRKAAQKAYAHDFISALPQGYDTLVGERGVKLSGGERQRVAIARAILADAPILILDEATSALDSVSEHYIQKALAELMRGRTTITVAHRLATIKSVDRILVFDQGRVVEQGAHEELSVREGYLYRQLYEMQALDLIGG
ncbi:MAG: ABC transporter ATP-binding protein [Rhodospirillales bacterium]|nr:ABC transporter ATP-binding protein [Rhodospirillales bacterium]